MYTYRLLDKSVDMVYMDCLVATALAIAASVTRHGIDLVCCGFPEENDLYISFGTARPGAEGVVGDNTLHCLSTCAAYATLADCLRHASDTR